MESTLMKVLLMLIPLVCLFAALPGEAEGDTVHANCVYERQFTSHKSYADPFHDITLDVKFSGPGGSHWLVPAFWAGGQSWKVRFAASRPGRYTYRSICSDANNHDLNGRKGTLAVTPYTGSNPLYRHGPLQVSADHRHFAHADGTPFFWLGDTWWMGLCKRIRWPEEFDTLTRDRVKKGYNVVQIVAGLYPDMPAFDPRGENEFGFPWTKDYGRIEPGYFDLADRRIEHLVASGIVPCVVGAWGYHMPWMGVERLKQHWRYVIARWGAYPVAWCVAGEANLPWYLAPGFPFDDRKQVADWTEVTRYARSTDPFHRPLSIHPTGLGHLSARGATDDVSLLDFDMLQTGHGDRSSLPPTVDAARTAYSEKPAMPWLNSEVCYEGILNSCHADVQRLMFWACIMSGAAGHTYGANGIWQMNERDRPYGNSPHGGTYGPTPWEDAMQLPGSGQLGLAKRFLESLPWTALAPVPDTAKYLDEEEEDWGKWIWFPEGDPSVDAPVGKRYFRRNFTLAQAPTSGQLLVACDDRFQAIVNGTAVGSGGDWRQLTAIDVGALLHAGANVIAIEGENMAANVPHNPAGLIASLKMTLADGSLFEISTNPQWRVSKTAPDGWTAAGFDDSQWSTPLIAALYGDGPWGRPAPSPYLNPYCADTGGRTPKYARLVYLPIARPLALSGLKPSAPYELRWYDPVAGSLTASAHATSDADGAIKSNAPPHPGQDWLLLLESE
jgi:hypothetical protein